MLLSVSHVRKLFGHEIVLDDVSFRLERREKAALVGSNGAGKTTLLKILTGEYSPDGGGVQWERGASTGFLSQTSIPSSSKTVLETATEARQHIADMQVRLRELEAKLEHSPTTDDLDEYSLLQEHFMEQGGYSIENDLKVVLKKLGFEEEEFEKPISALSGGEKTRLCLAKLLLEEPDLLILDEPTNHLDLEATEWLEGWIKGYGGAVLLVSHDRIFLQNTVQKVIEIRDGTSRTFPGSFEKYLQLAAEDDERIAREAEKQQKDMAKLDEFVRRFMNSQRTAQARGRLKMLERLEGQAIAAPKGQKGLKAGFKAAKRAGDIVLDVKKLSMEFGQQKLWQDVDWTVRWGERWGIIGTNGSGKSTLLKAAFGKLEPTSGVAKIGSNVELGWFSQDAEFLDPNDTPLEAFMGATGQEFGPARNMLGRFLISGDDVLRPIKTLSGGERVKTALAIITALQPNVLVLDEPTNHLDFQSREALTGVLQEFNGTLIVVSHDRWLLDHIAQHIMDIRPEEVLQAEGNYTDYRQWRERRNKPSGTELRATANVSTRPALNPRELSKEIGRLSKEFEQSEEMVSKLEAEMAALESKMANPGNEDIVAMSVRHGELQREIAEAIDSWTQLGERLDDLKSMQ